MRTSFIAVASIAALLALSSSAFAQTKTIKACQDEWRANRTAMQAAGKTEKAYVVECRAGKTAQPTTPSASTSALRKTRPKGLPGRMAREPGRNQAAGITEKAYVADCRAGRPPRSPPIRPPLAAGDARSLDAGRHAPHRPHPADRYGSDAPARPTVTQVAAGQYATEGGAKAHCPGELVVWANLSSKIFHFAGGRNYGMTKKGAYMCEREATSAGIRAAKNEKRPA